MAKKGEGPRPGRPTNRHTLAPYISQLKQSAPNHNAQLESAISAKKAGAIHLDALVTAKTLATAFVGLDITPYPEECQMKHRQIVAEMDCYIVAKLLSEGHLRSFLEPDGVSVDWMFEVDENSVRFENGLTTWAKKALAGNRKLYNTVFRFWGIFAELDIQPHVYLDCAEELAIVSTIFGEYENTITICDTKLASLDKDEANHQVIGARVTAYQASALSCLKRYREADKKFAEALKVIEDIRADIDRPKRFATNEREEYERFAGSIDVYERSILREELRAMLRPAWMALSEHRWPQEGAQGLRADDIRMRVDRLEKVMSGMASRCVPVDYDTLARAMLLVEPNKPETLVRVQEWMKLSRTRYREKEANETIDASIFVEDNLNATEALWCIAKGDQLDRAIKLVKRMNKAMDVSQRRHTRAVLITLQRLIRSQTEAAVNVTGPN